MGWELGLVVSSGGKGVTWVEDWNEWYRRTMKGWFMCMRILRSVITWS